MNRSILLLCSLLCTAAANAVDSSEFSTDTVESLNSTAPITSAAGSSDIHCTVQCSALGLAVCTATAYLAETGVCLFSAVSNADFSAAAPHSTAYRWVKAGPEYHVMLRRTRTDINFSFALNWTEYENGFGDGIDVWLGLRKIHELTGHTPKKLRVEVLQTSGVLDIYEYSGFSVGNASTNYTMTFDSFLSESSNGSDDFLTYHKGMQFSTMDRDNDLSSSSCSQSYENVGWWFKSCSYSVPTGAIYPSSNVPYVCVDWDDDCVQAILIQLLDD